MKLNAVGVNSRNIPESLKFYKILGFEFPELKVGEDHIETRPNSSGIKLMIDDAALAKEVLGEEPRPGNYSSFAVEYDTPAELNEIADKLKTANYKVFREPWDAFWGQRYAIVEDPDGHKVDLYASL